MKWKLSGSAAVTGIGSTAYSRESGRTETSLALEACQKAIEDSGIAYDDVDGVLCYGLNDSIHPQAIATGLGLPQLGYYANYFGGGQVAVSMLSTAAMLIHSGQAKNVVVFRALNGRSGPRLGGTGMEDRFVASGTAQYTYPHGWMTYPQYLAMAARRHMLKYGTTSEQFGAVAVSTRWFAERNERAILRKPMTLADHQESRMVADPFRLFDCCLESDGAAALLVSSSEQAQDLAHDPIYVLGAAYGGGKSPGFAFDGCYETDDLADLYAGHIGPRLWESSGFGPSDVDVASIYDCYTFSVISQLEGFGFCKPGEGGPFVMDGNIGLGGDIVVNPHGGMLSEAYVHGLNGAVEMVSQLRGHAGERQVVGAQRALATGFGVTTGCAVTLGRGQE